MPNRCDMHDDVRALREHGRQKRAIKPDGRHQVQAELLLPLVVTRRGEATAPARSTREHVHHDGDARQAREFKIEAHGQIRSRMTRSPATVKRKRRRIGLPGKLPLTFAITVLCAPMVCHETRLGRAFVLGHDFGIPRSNSRTASVLEGPVTLPCPSTRY